jgi:hypothetical protein
VFIVLQIFWLMPYLPDDEPAAPGAPLAGDTKVNAEGKV